MATVVDEYFLIEPNWEKTISLKKRWQTTFQVSINNTKKRSALFTWPRRSLLFDVEAFSYAHSSYIKKIIYKNINNILGVPFWQDRSILSSEAASGQNVLNIDSSEYRNYEVGAQCIIFESESSYEIGVIDSIAASQITLVSNLTSTWASGISVYPILKARVRKTQKIAYTTDSYSNITIEALEEYDTITRSTPSVASFPTYEGYPVFNLPPDWVKPVEEDQIHNYELLRYLGKSQDWTQWTETEFKHKAMFFGNGKEETQNIIDFFDYHKGRWGLFWRPSWLTDLQITNTAIATADTLEITNIDYPTFWQNTSAGLYVMLIWPDNTYEIKRIVTSTSTTIEIVPPLTNPIESQHINSFIVSFISLCNFSQDELDVKYITDSLTDLDLTFQTAFQESITTTTTTTTSSTTSTSSSTTTNTGSTTTTSSTASSSSTTSSTASSTTTNTQTGSTTSTSSTSSTASSTSTTSSTVSTTSTMSSTSTTSSTASSTTTNTQSTTTSSTTTTQQYIDYFLDTDDDYFLNSDDDYFKNT